MSHWLFRDVEGKTREAGKIEVLKVVIVASPEDINYLFTGLPSIFMRELGAGRFCLDIKRASMSEEELKKMGFQVGR